MSYRFMRIVLFFDLPTLTEKNRKEYARFRKFLIKTGFMMLQESVYVKLALNATTTNTLMNNLEKNKPEEGLIQILLVTEKQYSKLYMLLGENRNEVLDTTERLVFL
ncbi:CRISPR-associated endonuclease Cas2 [Leptotrichia wadei]|jgi:CRISPR-associated endoribonuclease cas2|uniref:CRISPR-associated endonuclease Cas2 n=1 Tax=Leptotrichia wadei TaxID=157687 RepID=UPI00352FA8C4